MIRIRHETRYDFAVAPSLGLQRLRLWPAPCRVQRVHSWTVSLEGLSVEARFTDSHGNAVMLASINADATVVIARVEGEVEPLGDDGVVGPHEGSPLAQYGRATPLTKAGGGILRLAAELEPADLASFHRLSDAIRERMPWTVGATDAATDAESALAGGRGVCQDHAHVFVAACRARGVPARYVSGYLLMDDREEQEASHAWAEAHLGGLGWVGFDVSNGYSPDLRYVRLATGLDYLDAAPVTGLLRFPPGAGAGDGTERAQRLSVSLNVARVAAQSQSQQ